MTRQLLDLGIALSRQVGLAFVLFTLVFVFVRRLVPLSRPRFGTMAPVMLGSSLLMGLAFTAVGAWYLGTQGFAGEVEPLVSSLSWLWQDGVPLYHQLDAPSQYSVLYGPSVFLTNGLFLRILGPSLMSAKLASLLAALASLLLIHASVARRSGSPTGAAAVTLAILLYWAHGFGIYLVRPDSLLVFAAAMGMYIALRAGPGLGVLGLAVLMGFAVNLKVHGFLYFLPALVQAARRWGPRRVVLAAGMACPLVLLPFLLVPAVSLGNYLVWLREATHHGLVTTDLPLTLRYAFLMLLPWIALVAWSPRPLELWLRERASILSLLAALLPTLVVAAKPGAGPVHLMPLVPPMVILAANAWRRERELNRRPGMAGAPRTGSVAVAAVLTLILAGTVTGYRSTRLVAWELGNATDLAEEVRGVMDRYDGLTIAMACGGENAAFRETWIRPLLAFADQPVLIDPISVMDRCLAGRPLSRRTYEALQSGRVQLWLVPRGQEPFAKANWYPPHEEIFPASFRNTFRANYRLADNTEHFDLWFWNGLQEQAGGAALVRAGGSTDGVMAPAD